MIAKTPGKAIMGTNLQIIQRQPMQKHHTTSFIPVDSKDMYLFVVDGALLLKNSYYVVGIECYDTDKNCIIFEKIDMIFFDTSAMEA
ncbi:MAG: hypothetical protein IPM04_14440 [Saprospiraceae bacterium]|nr:hypothetical protein [Candidatus Brachybacter algidus]MBK8748979.1 hypothetical protein [Candidatus Brachybacter algidus]